jgi:redox-sensitive bicupin YhaK (pirin superfamily)
MIRVRRSGERGYADFGWLKSRHTFSFGNYQRRQLHGSRPAARDQRGSVEAGRGFGAHSHRDMEILSWVLEGALQHKDSLLPAR